MAETGKDSVNATASPPTPAARRQYEAERRMADRIRSASATARDNVAAAVYADFARQFGQTATDASRRMGATAGKEVFLRGLLRDASSILEIGCGYGATLRALAPGRQRAWGLDIATPLIQAAGRHGGSLRFLQGSAIHFDFSDQPFDAIFSIDVLEHLHPDDVPLHLRAVHRSLVPGGRYVVMTPHAATGPHDISGLFGSVPRGLHLKEYTYADVLQLAREVGYAPCRSPTLPFRLQRYVPWLARTTLVPTWTRLPGERLLSRIPGRRARRRAFQTAALHTVCVVMTRPTADAEAP